MSRHPNLKTTAGPGRPKGSQNKATKELKDMILGALQEKGGQEWLAKQMDDNPGPFLSLLGKVLPTTLAGDSKAPIVAEIRRTIVDPKA